MGQPLWGGQVFLQTPSTHLVNPASQDFKFLSISIQALESAAQTPD